MSENQIGATAVIFLFTQACAMPFCLKGPLLSLIFTLHRAQKVLCNRVAWMNTLTDAQENEVAAAPKIRLFASLLSWRRSTFFL